MSNTITNSPSQHPVVGFNLENLRPGTRYEALACLPRFNISTDLAPDNSAPLIPECGFCFVCFQTLDLVFEFLTLDSVRVNETYFNVTCNVEANVEFFVIWTIVESLGMTSEPMRRELTDRDLVGGERISIQFNSMILEDGTDFIINTVLTAPEAVFDMGLQCTTESDFGSESRNFTNPDSNAIHDVSFGGSPLFMLFYVLLQSKQRLFPSQTGLLLSLWLYLY